MLSVLEQPLREGDPVAVIDDVEQVARSTASLVEEAGFRPVLIGAVQPSTEHLLAKIAEVSRAALCDHRLGQRASVAYTGAEIVARSNQRHIPAVLITTYADTDESTSIRQWRAGIPRLLRRGAQAIPERIAEALEVASREAQGAYSIERAPYRTVVRVEAVRILEGQSIAEVVVSAWDPKEVVELPATMICNAIDLPLDALPGSRFMAEVNIYAHTAGELYFRSFEKAPAIPMEWRT